MPESKNIRPLVAAFAIMALGGIASAAEPAASVRDQAWDAVFTRTEGWNGGDVAGSISLGDGRVLWMFGDSTLGPVVDGRRSGSRMINNSLAIHAWPAKPGEFDPPEANAIRFATGPTNRMGKPTSMFAPPEPRGADGNPAGSEAPRVWYWTTGGATIVTQPDGRRRLYVFLFRETHKPGTSGVWAFQRVGNTLAVIDDIAPDAELWRPRLIDIPHAIGDDRRSATQASISVGSSVMQQAGADGNLVTIFGVRTQPTQERELIAAEVPANALEDFSQWRFMAEGQRRARSAVDAVRLADGIPDEFTVQPLRHRTFDGFVLVHSELFLGSRIFARTASSLLGPWSAPRELYRAPEPAGDKQLFAYAAKGHAELSRPGELLVSYVVNAHTLGRMINDASIYRPRLVRVPLERVLSVATSEGR